MSEWQSIETAPKDATAVDLWCFEWVHPNRLKPDTYVRGRRITDCRWNDDKPDAYTNYFQGNAQTVQQQQQPHPFWESRYGAKIYPGEATFWMPIPEPPK